jgi:hypothetical protein
MSIKLCCWDKGNIRIYTKRLDLVNQAVKNGYFINVMKDKPYIYKPDQIKLWFYFSIINKIYSNYCGRKKIMYKLL